MKMTAMNPALILQCKELDEIATEDEVGTAVREQCDIDGVEMTICLRSTVQNADSVVKASSKRTQQSAGNWQINRFVHLAT